MPFDSAGTFNRVRSWVSDAAASIKIRADYHDNHDSDVASGLSTCITKDGRTQPTANIPMNQKKLVNLGEPTSPTDAATKNYVDTFKTYATGVSVTGANYPNGMVNFTATTGTTGLGWSNAAMSWVAKPGETGKYSQRIIATGTADGTGAELVTIDKTGKLGISGYITNNLSFEGGQWRVNTTGTGTYLQLTNTGTLVLASNDTATLQANQVTVPNQFLSIGQTTLTYTANDNCLVQLQKKGTAQTCSIRGMNAAGLRWNMELGNSTLETGTAYAGSDFGLTAYDNNGGGATTRMFISRATGDTTFWGQVSSSQNFVSSSAAVVLAATGAGSMFLRPNGVGNGSGQVTLDTGGNMVIATGGLTINNANVAGAYLGMGQRGRNGITGGYTSNWHNWNYASGLIYVMVDATNFGAIQMVCDYRTKRNEKPLPGMWDKVKALRPITYQYKAFPGIADDKDDDEVRWGFVAHELQAGLTKSAATFDKDAADKLQSPNLMVLVAALTKALQEAQQRIEALEAKLA
jgi:hypothetical protein